MAKINKLEDTSSNLLIIFIFTYYQNKFRASSYLPTKLPLQYCHRKNVSRSSSRWIDVVPFC